MSDIDHSMIERTQRDIDWFIFVRDCRGMLSIPDNDTLLLLKRQLRKLERKEMG